MKNAYVIVLSVLSLLFVTAACTTNVSGSDYVKGTLMETGFESEYLKLRFTLPENYILATEEDMLSLMDLGTSITGMNKLAVDYTMLTTVYEMMASSAKGLPNVSLMAEKLILSNINEEQYIEALKTQLSEVENINYSFHDELTSAEIAGQQYKKLTAETAMSGINVIQDYMIRKYGNRMIIFITTYTEGTIPQRDELMGSFTSF